jgi:hypothetical protein
MEHCIMEINMISTRSVIDDFEDALYERSLKYSASALEDVGFRRHYDIEIAIERAIKICSANRLPIREHFKSIYVADDSNHTVKKDWRLSKLAYTLAILNGDPEIPVVGRMQLEIINKFLNT